MEARLSMCVFVLSRDPELPESMANNDAESIVKLLGQKIVAFILLWYFVPVGWMWKNVTYHSSQLIHTLYESLKFVCLQIVNVMV